MKRKLATRVAAPFAAALALTAVPLLTAAPAHAGAICTVNVQLAKVYAKPSTGSRLVQYLDAGTEVAATTADNGFARVSHPTSGKVLGYTKDSLYCRVG